MKKSIAVWSAVHTPTYTHNCFTALWILSGTTRVSRFQKKHSPTHTYCEWSAVMNTKNIAVFSAVLLAMLATSSVRLFSKLLEPTS